MKITQSKNWNILCSLYAMIVLCLCVTPETSYAKESDHDFEECPQAFNRVSHFEIHADDPEATAAFYQAVFGWKVEKWDNPDVDYWMVMTGPCNASGGINGGIAKRIGPKPTGNEPVSSYVCSMAVVDVDMCMEKITNNGGKIVSPKMAIPTVGWLCYCTDIDGNLFGIMQPDPQAA